MASKKSLFTAAGSVLVAGALFSLLASTASTQSLGKVIETSPLALVEEGQQAYFVSLPTQKQLNTLNQRISSNPDLSKDKQALRSLYTPKIVALDKSLGKKDKQTTRHEVNVQDAATGETTTLSLLSYDGDKGRTFLAEPHANAGTLSQLKTNPKDASKHLVEFNFGLYVLDTNSMKLQPIGDHQARKAAYEKKNAEGAHELADGHDHPKVLYWSMDAVWSPDGTQIAFVSNRSTIETEDQSGRMSLWLHDVRTGKETLVHERAGMQPRMVGWTADNRVLLEEYTRVGTRNVASVIALDPKTKQRTLLAADASFISQSDDRQTLIVLREATDSAELQALQLATGTVTTLYKTAAGETFRSHLVDFSADHSKLVTDLQGADGTQALLVYHFTTAQTDRLSLPLDKQLTSAAVWAGEQLVVGVENLKELTSETLLMSVDHK